MAALFPYTQPALFAMPIAFILAYVFSGERHRTPVQAREREAFEDQYVRAQTGFGASGASH
jgi:cation/acetate symporter